MALERIVRPFQSFDVMPPRRVITGNGNSVAGVALQIGRTGTGRTMNGSQSYRQNVLCRQPLQRNPLADRVRPGRGVL